MKKFRQNKQRKLYYRITMRYNKHNFIQSGSQIKIYQHHIIHLTSLPCTLEPVY